MFEKAKSTEGNFREKHSFVLGKIYHDINGCLAALPTTGMVSVEKITNEEIARSIDILKKVFARRSLFLEVFNPNLDSRLCDTINSIFDKIENLIKFLQSIKDTNLEITPAQQSDLTDDVNKLREYILNPH